MDENYETAPMTDHAQEESPQPENRNIGRTIAIVIGVILLLAIIGGSIYGLATHPLITSIVRDIFIIMSALVTVLIGLFLCILIFQLQALIVLLRKEIRPILESTNQTASTVRGTTTFVSDAVVKPMIEVVSTTTGVTRAVKMMVDLVVPRRNSRPPAANKE